MTTSTTGSARPVRHSRVRFATWLPIALALLLGTLSPLPASPPNRGGDGALTDELPAAVARIFPGLVRIRVVMEAPGPGRILRQQGAGSGIVISDQGHVVTNHHVAGNASYLVCDLPGMRDLPARLVGTDPLADIAVVQIDLDAAGLVPGDLVVAPWGNSDKLGIGTEVFAMGSPAAISQSVTRGIIANPQMVEGSMPKLDGEDVGLIVRWLVHDATIFGGNSGGPLVNARGEVIGINEIGFANLGGAIPGNLARQIAEEIIERGEVERSYLGLSIQPRLDEPSDPEHFGGRGALVASLVDGGPAANAGLRVGDILLELDGRPIDCAAAEDLPLANGQLFSLPIGRSFPVRFLREGNVEERRVTAEVRGKARAPLNESREWGITYSNLTRALRFENDLPDTSGAIILGVRSGGPADSATPPLAPGDLVVAVGDRTVTDAASFAAAFEAIGEEPRSGLLRVRRGSDDIVIFVEGRTDEKSAPSARVRRPHLPISTQPVTGTLAKALGLPDGKTGVRVTATPDDVTAVSALQVGDVITAVGGTAIRVKNRKDQRALDRITRKRSIDETVEVALLRDGAETTVSVTLIAPPETPDLVDRAEIEELGFDVRDLVSSERHHALTKEGGVMIEEVAPGGWGNIAGLRSGDRIVSVDRTATPDLETFQAHLANRIALEPESIVFLVLRGDVSRFISVEPTWNAR